MNMNLLLWPVKCNQEHDFDPTNDHHILDCPV